MGASAGLALTARKVAVQLEDSSPTALAVAVQVGAGQARDDKAPAPKLVIVATPPDVTARVVVEQLKAQPEAVVTDLASVKAAIFDELAQGAKDDGLDLGRYVGSHPMAGKERSGPAAATADLFTGRPWVIAATDQTNQDSTLAVRDLAIDLGATVHYLEPAAHDAAVALVSHVPQVVASLVAARLQDASPQALELAGQGLRDVTRIAKSDPALWAAILTSNGPVVAAQLRAITADLERAAATLEAANRPKALGQSLLEISSLMIAGNRGAERIPGKHGGAQIAFDQLTVVVPDRVGALAGLFALLDQLKVNLEDLNLEHAAGQAVGLATLSVPQGRGGQLSAELELHGWKCLV